MKFTLSAAAFLTTALTVASGVELGKFKCAGRSPIAGRKSSDLSLELLVLQSGRITNAEKGEFCNSVARKSHELFVGHAFKDFKLNVAFFNDYAENSGYECYRRDRSREHNHLLTHRSQYVESACRRVPTGVDSPTEVGSTPSMLAAAIAANDDHIGWSGPSKKNTMRLILVQTLDPESTAAPGDREAHPFAKFTDGVHTCATDPAEAEALARTLEKHDAYIGIVALDRAVNDGTLRHLMNYSNGRIFLLEESQRRDGFVNWDENAARFAHLIACGGETGAKIEAAQKVLENRRHKEHVGQAELVRDGMDLVRAEKDLERERKVLAERSNALKREEQRLRAELKKAAAKAERISALKAKSASDRGAERAARVSAEVAEKIEQNLLAQEEEESRSDLVGRGRSERETEKREAALKAKAAEEQRVEQEQEKRRQRAARLQKEAEENAARAAKQEEEAEQRRQRLKREKRAAERKAALAARTAEHARQEELRAETEAARARTEANHIDGDLFKKVIGDYDFAEQKIVYDAAGDTINKTVVHHVSTTAKDGTQRSSHRTKRVEVEEGGAVPAQQRKMTPAAPAASGFAPTSRDAVVAASAVASCLLVFTSVAAGMRIFRRTNVAYGDGADADVAAAV